MENLTPSLMALFTGTIVWVIFSLLNLPVPAPNVLPWIMWIIGIYLWAVIVKQFIK